MTRRILPLLLLAVAVAPLSAQIGKTNNTVLIITSDASNYVLHAGGTIAQMIEGGMDAYLIRVGNDEKDSWDLGLEETAIRNKQESEAAAKILGIKKVISLGFRSAEFLDVPFSTMRDRLAYYIRLYKPRVLFIPNPYTEHDRNHDHYYAGRAAEDAGRAAAFDNYLPAMKDTDLGPHLTPEIYYFAPPVDPARREPESTATFVPQPKMLDISKTLDKKIKAAQALKTINRSLAMRIKQRLESTDRRLGLLENVDEASINKLIEEQVRGLALLSAEDANFQAAEEFRYAGVEFRIPAAFR
ncbi:MAG: PIG-L family deacetylase [Acidobacteria bacterium]|nr:PIG-L family deacetylase [Acidobacteriota bacterium]